MTTRGQHQAGAPSPEAIEPNGREIEVFSACPVSLRDAGRSYLDLIRDVAVWSERHGCRGILIYSDNRLVDPWLVAQVVVQSTRALSPLVAVQPVYMHPYAVAKKIASFAELHARRLFINWVAGGFKKDLEALGDGTPHDERYERLLEYAEIVRDLTDGEPVTRAGDYYRLSGARLRPAVAQHLRPEYMLSGSSPAGRAASEALGARSVTYALPSSEHQTPPCRAGRRAGLRMGIIVREERADAWRVAYERFPASREGELTRALARKVSDSHWHETLCRLAEERSDEGDPFWMVPFENYRTMCPYLVGTREEVASELSRYVAEGFGTFILDEPDCEADLANARAAFQMATSTAVETS